MKEYNWREEREKYKVPFTQKEGESGQTGGAQSSPPPPIQLAPPSSGRVWKAVSAIVILVLFGLGGLFTVPKITGSGKKQDGNKSKQEETAVTAKDDGEVVKVQESSKAAGKRSTDSAMMLAEVAEKYKHAVGVVVFWIKDSNGKIERRTRATVWACGPNEFATNGHVVYGLKRLAQGYIQPLVARKMLEKIERIEKQENTIIEEKTKAEAEEGEMLAVNKQKSVNHGGINIQLDIDKAKDNENERIAQKLNEYQKKVGDEVMFKQMEETKDFVLKSVVKDMGCEIFINQQPNMSLPVVTVQVHPQYDYDAGVLSPDVAKLTVDGTVKDYFPIADTESLRNLKPGMPIGFLGFPMEDLINENVNLESPIATLQTGIVTAISDFHFKDAGFSGNYFIPKKSAEFL